MPLTTAQQLARSTGVGGRSRSRARRAQPAGRRSQPLRPLAPLPPLALLVSLSMLPWHAAGRRRTSPIPTSAMCATVCATSRCAAASGAPAQRACVPRAPARTRPSPGDARGLRACPRAHAPSPPPAVDACQLRHIPARGLRRLGGHWCGIRGARTQRSRGRQMRRWAPWRARTHARTQVHPAPGAEGRTGAACRANARRSGLSNYHGSWME